MKTASTFLLIASCIIILGSCSKHTNKDATGIIGTWELRQRSGGMLPGFTTYPSGNGNKLIFTTDTYQLYTNGQLTKSGTYNIVSDSTVEKSVCLLFPAGQFANRVVYDGNNSRKAFFELAGNKLSFVEGCYALDAGHKEEYQRQ